ncbi:MAG: DUF2510 domain-containing protein, partial [Microbacteriaceae bacterium]
MTGTSYAAIPAGWYPDPRGSKQRRWWDGTSWTHALEALPEPVATVEPVSVAPVASPEPVSVALESAEPATVEPVAVEPVAVEPVAPVSPATPAYAGLPGPGSPAYTGLVGAASAVAAQRTPSPSAPMVARALGAEAPSVAAGAPQQPLPTRRQLREAAALREAELLTADTVEVTEPSPAYAMGPTVSSTHQAQAHTPQPVEQLTDPPVEPNESRAASTVAPMTLADPPVSATHTFVPAAPVAQTLPVAPEVSAVAAPVAAAPVAAVHVPAAPVAAAPLAAAPVPAAPVAALPDFAALLETSPVGAADASQSPFAMGPAYQPFGMTPKITSGTMTAPTSANTAAVWLITVLPTIALGAAAVLLLFAPDFYTPFTLGALAFVFAIAGVALAFTDRRQLTVRSHQSTASPAWILLTPLGYLIARAVNTMRQAGRGVAPAIVFVLLSATA